MSNCPAILRTDFYKTIHHNCYPEGTERLTYYWTARTSRVEDSREVVFFGLQAFINRHLIKDFRDNFFNLPVEEAVREYKDFISATLGPNYADTDHIEALHNLGYLPLEIKAVPEGTVVPIGVPMVEITNTHPDFFWLPGYLETLMSCNLWHPITSATTARRFYKLITKHYEWVKEDKEKIPYAISDFSMRGMTSLESAEASGAGHLLYFNKTANMPAVQFLRDNYRATLDDLKNAGTPSTEHSVMCSYGKENEIKAYETLLDKYPEGNLSIVSDTYDLWNVIENYLPKLKDRILNRNGTIIIRPDSGDPVDIVCGTNESFRLSKTPEEKGVVQLLWELFYNKEHDKNYFTKGGYGLLDPHIRVIYGDAITYERCNNICYRLMHKGFAPSNVIFGIGSYTYQYVTRDTYGFALKATHAVINGEDKKLFKDPITDKDAMKKSQKGLCYVYNDPERGISYMDNLDRELLKAVEGNNLLQTVFKNGGFVNPTQSFSRIRQRCRNGI